MHKYRVVNLRGTDIYRVQRQVRHWLFWSELWWKDLCDFSDKGLIASVREYDLSRLEAEVSREKYEDADKIKAAKRRKAWVVVG